MNTETKIHFALMQIDNVSNLIAGNEYERFFVSHLVSIKVELERQLTNLTHSSKIKE